MEHEFEHEHEHHHHHHHEDGEECGCGHDHEHEHEHELKSCGKGTYTVGAYHHDQALVAAGECNLTADDPAAVYAALEEGMKELAAWVQAEGGFIGHIKSGVDTTRTKMLSITDRELQQKEAPGTRLHINLASIVFLVDLEELEEHLEVVLRKICEA